MISMLALLLAPMVLSGQGQDRDRGLSVRFGVSSEVRVGKPAPELMLPYATADGRGPDDQPFHLRKELGRVVVMVFHQRLDSMAAATWREVAALATGTVATGVTSASLDSAMAFAGRHGLSAKFIADPDGRTAMLWGAGQPIKTAVLVVGRDGVIRYQDRDFRPGSSSGSKLAAAIQAAREGGR